MAEINLNELYPSPITKNILFIGGPKNGYRIDVPLSISEEKSLFTIVNHNGNIKKHHYRKLEPFNCGEKVDRLYIHENLSEKQAIEILIDEYGESIDE